MTYAVEKTFLNNHETNRRWLCSGLLRHVVWWKFTIVSEDLAAFIIALMIEPANISETSVNYCQTARLSIPEDSHFQF
jgi:hypothetical protein